MYSIFETQQELNTNVNPTQGKGPNEPALSSARPKKGDVDDFIFSMEEEWTVSQR